MPAQKAVHLGFCLAHVFDRYHKQFQLHFDLRPKAILKTIFRRCAAATLHFSYFQLIKPPLRSQSPLLCCAPSPLRAASGWLSHCVRLSLRPALLCSWLTWGQNHPETNDEVGGEAREVEEAVGAARVVRADEPTAAVNHAEGARYATLRVGRTPSRVGGIPVVTPLPYIPVHVHQSPRIRPFRLHRMRRASTVGKIPRILRQGAGAHIIPVAKARVPRSRTAAILPFRLRWQPIRPARRDSIRSPLGGRQGRAIRHR